VIGYPGDKSAVDATVRAAAAAAHFDLTLFSDNSPRIVHQSGFIVFVSADPVRRRQWFSAGPQPTGWSADPAGMTWPLPGSPEVAKGISLSAVGGARVVVGPGLGSNETPVLVHEFVHDVYATDAIRVFGNGDNVPAWTVEGVARLIEAICRTKVLRSRSGGNYTVYSSSVIERGWRNWYVQRFG
jgi:hypothetical protein